MAAIKGTPITRSNILALALLLPVFGVAQKTYADAGAFDVTQVPIEQLVETEFIPASRIARQISDAPSAVSIVTSKDIRDYGYRSLADILQSMRGLYVTSSVTYDFLGGRGFGSPGDYAGRILLMIDGYATNDNVYNQIFLREDALLDVEMIERVEYIPGPGSTTYGNGAFLGVINIVTKHGKNIGGTQASAGVGPNGARRERLTYGKQLDNGADVLASFSMYGDNGRDIRFTALDGVTDLNGEPLTNLPLTHLREVNNRRMFFKGAYQGWTAEVGHARQNRRNDGFFDSYFLPDIGKSTREVDDNSFGSLKYDADLGEQLKSSTHLYYGQYLYSYDGPDGPAAYMQRSTGRWWGLDNKFVGNWFDRHQMLFGGEFRDDYQQKFFDLNYPFNNGLGLDTGMRTLSLYVQDEYRLTDTLSLTPGLRYDDNSKSGKTSSPRMAAIYCPWQASTFKLSYGKAFRYPNAWEYYILDFNKSVLNNPDTATTLKPESIETTELVWQQQLTSESRLTASLYRNHFSDKIDSSIFLVDSIVNTEGQELGIEHVEQDGFRLSASIAHQNTRRGSGWQLGNLPHWLGKLNIVQPLLRNRINAGFEVQNIGPRYDMTGTGTIVKANTVANLTFNSSRLIENTVVSFNIRNLFNSHQEDVLGIAQLRTMPLAGRQYWLQLEYTLK
jgi:iron complex outermembrane receptor protein